RYFLKKRLVELKKSLQKISVGKPNVHFYKTTEKPDSIRIDKTGLYGIYRGVEFADTGDVSRRDVAHRFSNRVADTLGKYLKAQFKAGNYLSIDFQKTKITRYFLKKRLVELKKSLQKISVGKPNVHFYKTTEKFQEYWIQFKHKDYQRDCGK
ncbi:MAG: hypothetical protein RL059_1447, partial [Bacteroidota bacterium]